VLVACAFDNWHYSSVSPHIDDSLSTCRVTSPGALGAGARWRLCSPMSLDSLLILQTTSPTRYFARFRIITTVASLLSFWVREVCLRSPFYSWSAFICASFAGMIFVVLTLATYMAGYCFDGVKSWDMYSTQFAVMGAVNLKGFQPTPKTTKYGGTMVVIALITAAALCTDVLVQYVYEYGVERSWTMPALDVVARGTTNARVELNLVAVSSPGQESVFCSLSSLALSSAVVGRFSLTSQSSVSSGGPLECSFSVSCPSVTIALSPYPVSGVPQAPATLTVGLGAFLQVGLGRERTRFCDLVCC
jgi:hypothetical protein